MWQHIADELARGGSVRGFLGPEPDLRVSRQEVQHRLSRWLANKHRASWRSLSGTLRQARELISGPDPGTTAKLMSFNRTQSRAVVCLLTGHNTLRRHLRLLLPHQHTFININFYNFLTSYIFNQ
jgi:hypothetical protein